MQYAETVRRARRVSERGRVAIFGLYRNQRVVRRRANAESVRKEAVVTVVSNYNILQNC